jgi:transposase
MSKKNVAPQEQPTIWEIPDDIWPILQPLLEAHYPAKPTAPRRVDLRRVVHGSIFRLRTGCQWQQLPTPWGDDSTGHRHVQLWCQRGIWARLGAVLVEACDAWAVTWWAATL